MPPTNNSAPETSVPSVPLASASVRLGSMVGLINNAFTVVQRHWAPLFIIAAITTAISFALPLIIGALILGMLPLLLTNPLLVLGISFPIILAAVWAYIVFYATMLKLVSDTMGQETFSTAMLWGFKCSFSLWWIMIINFLILLGGFTLLIIPGLLFLVWFLFAPYVLAAEGERGLQALIKSKAYVRGQFWSIVLRLLPLVLFILLTGLISSLHFIVQMVVSVAVAPFMAAYMFVLYQAAKAVRDASPLPPKKESPGAYIGLALLGLFLPIASSFILASLDSARQDVQEIGTIAEQRAELTSNAIYLELYAAANNEYPATLQEVDLFTYQNFDYAVAPNKKSYTLCLAGSIVEEDCIFNSISESAVDESGTSATSTPTTTVE